MGFVFVFPEDDAGFLAAEGGEFVLAEVDIGAFFGAGVGIGVEVAPEGVFGLGAFFGCAEGGGVHAFLFLEGFVVDFVEDEGEACAEGGVGAEEGAEAVDVEFFLVAADDFIGFVDDGFHDDDHGFLGGGAGDVGVADDGLGHEVGHGDEVFVVEEGVLGIFIHGIGLAGGEGGEECEEEEMQGVFQSVFHEGSFLYGERREFLTTVETRGSTDTLNTALKRGYFSRTAENWERWKGISWSWWWRRAWRRFAGTI